MLLPGIRRRRVGVGLRQRSNATGVDGAESVGDAVACSVHGLGRLEAELEDDVCRNRDECDMCVRTMVALRATSETPCRA